MHRSTTFLMVDGTRYVVGRNRAYTDWQLVDGWYVLSGDGVGASLSVAHVAAIEHRLPTQPTRNDDGDTERTERTGGRRDV